ncbi:MAG: type 1 glutamine amidotransferase [bacterium]
MHTASEGPGTIEDYLKSVRATYRIVRLYAGDRLPTHLNDLDAVITMGGPMNVYEEDKYPFLRDEIDFLQRAIEAKIPVLGICLGAQMIAKACGAAIRTSLVKELGWYEVILTEAGFGDEFFYGLPKILQVLQWHEDMFELPPAASLLATSKGCPHQAFRCRQAYGLQFHIEINREMLFEWFADLDQRDGIILQFEHMKHDIAAQAKRIYSNFFAIARR